jgi:hypothetical protein
MTDKSQTGSVKPKIRDLEINKETVKDLTEGETEGVEGGLRPQSKALCNSHPGGGGCQPSHRLTGCNRTGCPTPGKDLP